VKEAIKSDDEARIKSAMENLQKKSQKIGEMIYKAQGQQGGGSSSSSSNDGDEKVVDAEIVDDK